MKLSTIIRIILSGVIIYFVYKETGIATTIFAVLITIRNELSLYNLANIPKEDNEQLEELLIKKSKWQQRMEEMQKIQKTKQSK